MKNLESRYSHSVHTWSSELEMSIEAAARRLGSLEQEIKGLYENQKLAGSIKQLQDQRNALGSRLLEVDAFIESLSYSQEVRKQNVQLEVAETLGRLLREDMNRQAEFQKAENVQFSFTDNVVAVEGSTKFSESSTVVLRHLFHLALLSTSTRMPEMRLPRFMMLDGIEDGGMELERSYRLQEIIINECAKFKCDYQLIFSTSQIAPQFENSKYVVGRQFSENNRALRVI